MNNRILFLVKLPPPHTGATAMNRLVTEAPIVGQNFSKEILNVSYAESTADLGSISLKKFARILKYHIKLLIVLIFRRPNLIYFQISPVGMAFIRDLLFVCWIKLFRIKILFHLHGKGIKGACQKSEMLKTLYRWGFKNEQVICLSNLLIEDIEQVMDAPPHILQNCLTEDITFDEKRIKVYDFVFLSNLTSSKGVYVFLDALQIVTKMGIDYSAIIIGQPVEINEKSLQVEIESRGLSNCVMYKGPVFGAEKFELLAQSKCMVFPTLNDVWGLVILEAFSQKVPVIASVEGAIPEMVIDGETGFLVEKANITLIAERMEWTLSNPHLTEQMGLRGNKLLNENFTVENFHARLLRILQICSQ
ncbi:MAG: glycosyltransferase [Flavobacteriales bacterium]|nr:glycosyltransferase [Flavobacteriales bacterium]